MIMKSISCLLHYRMLLFGSHDVRSVNAYYHSYASLHLHNKLITEANQPAFPAIQQNHSPTMHIHRTARLHKKNTVDNSDKKKDMSARHIIWNDLFATHDTSAMSC